MREGGRQGEINKDLARALLLCSMASFPSGDLGVNIDGEDFFSFSAYSSQSHCFKEREVDQTKRGE